MPLLSWGGEQFHHAAPARQPRISERVLIWSRVVTLVNAIFPTNLRRLLRRAKRSVRFQRNRFRTTGDIFDNIYSNSLWGGETGEIYSGSGSEGIAADQYVATVTTFLNEIKCRSVVDIGCGDFRIGTKIAATVPTYIGLDVSRVVIEWNKAKHSRDGVSFAVCDAEKDQLPSADVCLIRQVLQHLPNKSIETILRRLTASYSYVVVTEHEPAPARFQAFNLDKPAGPDIRCADGSGVYVDRPPFGHRIHRTLLDIPLSQEQTHMGPYSTHDPTTWERLKTVVISGKDRRFVGGYGSG
jgi:SAM-dependent methyltransferase